jgi:hypothetical protein
VRFCARPISKEGLNEDLSVDTAGDIVYAMNSSEFLMLFVREGGGIPRPSSGGWPTLS